MDTKGDNSTESHDLPFALSPSVTTDMPQLTNQRFFHMPGMIQGMLAVLEAGTVELRLACRECRLCENVASSSITSMYISCT